MKSKAGRPKKRLEDKVKFKRVAMHIATYELLKKHSVDKNASMASILDSIVKNSV